MARRRPELPLDKAVPRGRLTGSGAFEDVILGGPLVRGGGTEGGRKEPGSMAAPPSGTIRPEYRHLTEAPYDDYLLGDETGEEDSAERTRGSLAPLTDAPTSSTNPQRPRTIAAGYASSTRTLSVVFRDGTPWNYYEVSPLEWANFRRAKSKGRFIRLYLDAKPYGPPRDEGFSFERKGGRVSK